MKRFFGFFISLILLGLVIWYLGGLGEVLSLLRKIESTFVVLALFVITLDRIIMTYKWGLLLRARGQHLSLFQGMKIYCASMVWGLFLPTTVGADAIRVVSTLKAGLDSKEVVASIIIERVVGFIVALSFGLLSLGILFQLGLLDARFGFLGWIVGATFFFGIAVFVGSMNQRLFVWGYGLLPDRVMQAQFTQRIKDFHKTYQDYRNNKLALVAFFSLTFLELWMSIVFAWVIAIGMGIHVSLIFIAGVLPLALLIARLPVSIDGWGVFDSVFILLMSLAGVSAAEAVAIGFAARILQVATWLPWWLSHVMSSGGFQQARNLALEGK